MKALIFLGILTGLDNLQVSPALGVLNMTARKRLMWAVMFGLSEALMPLLGLQLGTLLHEFHAPWAEKLGPVVLLLCGLLVILTALRKQDLESLVSSKWAMVSVPLLLSIDNLLAGVGVGATGASILTAAVVIGGISTTMCLAGLQAGHLIRRWLPGTPAFYSGGLLLVLGICGLIWD